VFVNIVKSRAGGVVQSMSVEIIQETRGASVPKSLDLRNRVWYNLDMSSICFNIPRLVVVILKTVPLIYFIKVLRGIILKGNGFGELYKEFAILVVFGIVFLALATLKFKKKID
jgi:ABC-type multidrug transport system permease subunit